MVYCKKQDTGHVSGFTVLQPEKGSISSIDYRHVSISLFTWRQIFL